ncbi:hypothetical protein JCM1840_001407, partial [Sporobolomyces johnsonii]
MADRTYNLRSRAKPSDAAAPAEPALAAGPSSPSTSTNPSTSPTKPTTPDEEAHVEFGGAPGTLAMMLGFPALFYYLYVCLFFND